MTFKKIPTNSKNTLKKYYKNSSLYLISILLLFICIRLLTTVKPAYRFSSQMITNWTSDIDSSTFLFLLGMENRSFKQALPKDQSLPQLSAVFFQVVTNIKPNDPRSLFGQEIPGLSTSDSQFMIAGEGVDYTNLSFESSPPLEDVLKDREAVFDEPEETDDPEQKDDQTTGDREVAFIYNTHNRESFLPHLPGVTDPDLAHHDKVNITKVSERFAESLESHGIGASYDTTDHMSVLNEKGWTYGKSYRASRSAVEEAISTNEDVEYIFDLHRDSLPRDKTTVEINGESYAQILTVIGAEHSSFEKNLALATDIHYLIDEKHPGLSKGVIPKEGPGNNGIYNQDVLDNSLLFEIGGYENTLEELYRTADLLAEIFSEFYWEAEKVQADEEER